MIFFPLTAGDTQKVEARSDFSLKKSSIEKDKVKNEVVCCYFDIIKGNLQVRDDVKDLRFATCPLRMIYIYNARVFKGVVTYSKP